MDALLDNIGIWLGMGVGALGVFTAIAGIIKYFTGRADNNDQSEQNGKNQIIGGIVLIVIGVALGTELAGLISGLI
jgi:hypothetical protein